MRIYPAIWVIVMALLAGCVNDIKVVNKLTSQTEATQEEAKNLLVVYSSKGHVKVRVTSPRSIRYIDKGYTEMPEGGHVEFYNDSAVKTSEMWANYGRMYEKTDQLLARDNVRVVNTKGETLESEELLWDPNTKKISTNRFVKITTAKEIIYGDGLEANRDLSDYKIKKIKGTIHLDNEAVE